MLACDGFWDVCTAKDAIKTIETFQDDLDVAAEKLVDEALFRNSTDNVSVLLVRLGED